MRADRLVATLLILQRRGRVTARELAAELEVSEKTARRDLEALCIAGLPLYSQAGRNGGWQLLGGASTDLSGLTADEARNLFLAAGASLPLGADTRGALRKLLSALPETFRDDAEVAAQAVVVDPTGWGSAPPASPPAHLPAVQRAVVERRRIRLAYVDRQRTETERVVDPLGVVSKGSAWYLVADTDHGRRTFRLNRMRSVEVTDERAVRPPDFDLRAAWQDVVAAVGERRLTVRATVRIDPSFVPGLRGQFGGDMMLAELDRPSSVPPEQPSIGPSDDGRVEVMIGGPSAIRIAEHLAGWGALIEVLEPDEVRDHLLRVGRELVQRYGASGADRASTATVAVEGHGH